MTVDSASPAIISSPYLVVPSAFYFAHVPVRYHLLELILGGNPLQTAFFSLFFYFVSAKLSSFNWALQFPAISFFYLFVFAPLFHKKKNK